MNISKHPPNINTLSQIDFETEIDKGFSDIKNGNVESVEKVFSDLRKELEKQ